MSRVPRPVARHLSRSRAAGVAAADGGAVRYADPTMRGLLLLSGRGEGL